jgi:peptide deformylase
MEYDIANLKISKSSDDLLRQPTNKFNFTNPPFDPIEFSHALVQRMIESGGIGLAANQVRHTIFHFCH